MAKSSYEEFQERWEQEATREGATFDKMSVRQLLELVRLKQWGDYYALWHAIGDRATLAEAGPMLMEVLHSDAEYLNRYHCAAALIKMAGEKLRDWTPVQLSAGSHPYRDNLEKVRAILATPG